MFNLVEITSKLFCIMHCSDIVLFIISFPFCCTEGTFIVVHKTVTGTNSDCEVYRQLQEQTRILRRLHVVGDGTYYSFQQKTGI